jgi:hypothetical protein
VSYRLQSLAVDNLHGIFMRMVEMSVFVGQIFRVEMNYIDGRDIRQLIHKKVVVYGL